MEKREIVEEFSCWIHGCREDIDSLLTSFNKAYNCPRELHCILTFLGTVSLLYRSHLLGTSDIL